MDSTIRPEQLAEGVYLVPLQASNVYLWESDGLLSVVDTGVPGSADVILAAVDALGHLHFSEDPAITRFVPHVAATAQQPEAYVWAVDAARSPDCWVSTHVSQSDGLGNALHDRRGPRTYSRPWWR